MLHHGPLLGWSWGQHQHHFINELTRAHGIFPSLLFFFSFIIATSTRILICMSAYHSLAYTFSYDRDFVGLLTPVFPMPGTQKAFIPNKEAHDTIHLRLVLSWQGTDTEHIPCPPGSSSLCSPMHMLPD